jgi:ABC-type glycerol-3-phosphate transport system permease component
MSRSVLAALGRVPLYVVVSALAILMALPSYWMVITAFSPAPDIIAFPPR